MRKKDEMEQQLANKAIKITWFVTVMVLFIIGGYQSYVNGTSQNIFLVIASLSVSLLILLERYYLSKVNEDNKFKKMLALIVVLVIVFLTLGMVWSLT